MNKKEGKKLKIEISAAAASLRVSLINFTDLLEEAQDDISYYIEAIDLFNAIATNETVNPRDYEPDNFDIHNIVKEAHDLIDERVVQDNE